MASDHPLISVFSGGTLYELTPTGTDAGSYFGGPHQDHIHHDNLLRHCQLHHIATLNHARLGIPTVKFGFSISLFYGLAHEGCVLSYHRLPLRQCSSLTSNQRSPHRIIHIPVILPFCHITGSEAGTLADARRKRFRAGFTTPAGKFVMTAFNVVVSQHPHVGVCLFDPSDETEIVFEYDYEQGRVRAASQCL